MSKSIYITTTTPYVNANPHIGFALEVIQADTIARFFRQQGYDVTFNTGTDEHGLKIYEKAREEGKDPKAYCDEYAKKFENLKSILNLSYTHFIRTTDPHHKKAAQEFWKRCEKSGDIYKKNYTMKYCVGCELEKTDSELVDGRCPLHPTKEIQIIKEENYFFRFSKYQNKLLELYKNQPDFVVPEFRLNEIQTFVEKGLQDFSISRLKNKLPWGVNVPGDPEHIMYVWFDALINYISTLGWPEDEKNFKKYWPGIQLAGKDNLRQQSAIWQAMLMSAGLPQTKQIFIHGFITSEGKKMSKTLGNVVDPVEVVKKYGTDVLRYYLLREIPPFDDGDFSYHRMDEIYISDLANELGNLVSRVTTLGEKDSIEVKDIQNNIMPNGKLNNLVKNYHFNEALELLWENVKSLNKELDDFAPWKKTPEQRLPFLTRHLEKIHSLAHHLSPFLPETGEKIMQATQGKITKTPPLFPRLS